MDKSSSLQEKDAQKERSGNKRDQDPEQVYFSPDRSLFRKGFIGEGEGGLDFLDGPSSPAPNGPSFGTQRFHDSFFRP